MKQTTTRDKLLKNRPITDCRLCMFFKDVFRPVLNRLAGFRIPYKIIVEHPYRLCSARPVIYAVNHFCFADTPIMGGVTPKRPYILSGRQRLGFFDWLYFILNGVIFVDRKDKSDMAASKLAITEYLNKKRSIVMFPEGTWNLTENQLMMPMKWGIIDVSRETGVPIVPVVLEYDREAQKCFVCFGAPMKFHKEVSRADAINALRDTMATMRWEFWERNGIFSRWRLDLNAERKRLFYSVEEFPAIDWDYESSCIYHPYIEPQEAFAYLDRLIPCRENAFLIHTKLRR